ncbi:m-AAA protease-interacting protein 1, mitochondrial isoform X2 [Drosophila eugracilis]|uniref:m-AAA protease-interacting protein 1, mitochondrial isoform X2 n=1 Tax=Drosophila eugracilis TaxID=29029 RepID=UPI001BDA81E8|nr:m-AAA protease-interacting protein 1, mitochondrial isoform X2 [Drosophila eugracilis]
MQNTLRCSLGMVRSSLTHLQTKSTLSACKGQLAGARRSFALLPQEQESRESPNRLPRLMDFPEIVWPSALNTLKNWITIQFIIRPYFDSEFQLKDFIYGAKQALQVVSSKMMGGDLDSLEKLVSAEAIAELRPVIQKLSMTQRRQLEIKESDIYLSFPYQVGIMFDEANDKLQKRFVEITMVFHVMRGLSEMRERGEEVPWNMGLDPA